MRYEMAMKYRKINGHLTKLVAAITREESTEMQHKFGNLKGFEMSCNSHLNGYQNPWNSMNGVVTTAFPSCYLVL